METRGKQKPVLERECQDKIVQAAMLAGWQVHAELPAQYKSGRFATHVQGHIGFPDLVLARGAHLFFVELKRKPNKPSYSQLEWIDRLSRIAPNVYAQVLWVPEEMDAFIMRLTKRDNGPKG